MAQLMVLAGCAVICFLLWISLAQRYDLGSRDEEISELKARLYDLITKCPRRPWRGHGRLHFGAPTKREDKPVKIEVDEQVDVNLPDIVDDDGDAVEVDQVVWATSDEAIAVFRPVGDGKSQAILKARGVVGQVRVTATVYAADGGNGAYTGDVAIGLGVPVGGQLGFGTPTKISPSE